MILDRINLNAFLKLGYFIDYHDNRYQLDYSHIDRLKFKGWSEDELITYGITAFRRGIAESFDPNQEHVLPLSGGLDSRAILAGLLEFTPASHIHTYTFGTPGTFDYEIGNLVAERTGTQHTRFPLTEYKYHLEELLDISRRINNQTVLFHHPPVWEIDRRFGGALFWSGYIGDLIAGKRMISTPSANINEAKHKYFKTFAYVTSLTLSDSPEQDFYPHINFNWIDRNRLNLDEQIRFQERVPKFIVPHLLMQGFRYKTPFINNDFMDFMFSIEDCYRLHQTLYKRMLLKAYPQLFTLPTKNTLGFPLDIHPFRLLMKRALLKGQRLWNKFIPTFLDRNTNYLDFNKAIRERMDLQKLCYNNLMDLERRKLIDWVPIEAIWRDHCNHRGNYADAIIVLVSLEIHLKASQR